MGKGLVIGIVIAIIIVLILIFSLGNFGGDSNVTSDDSGDVDDTRGGLGVDDDFEGCGQEDPNICQDLPDGIEVPSCDSCNTCTCYNGGAACTEIACNTFPDGGNDAGAPQSYTVEISSAGFSPSSLTINVGDIVVFVAVDGSNRWPASAFHPTHTVYPEDGGCIGSAFDACGGVANGDSYPFVFNEVGSWGYHDHLSPGKTGTITVE